MSQRWNNSRGRSGQQTHGVKLSTIDGPSFTHIENYDDGGTYTDDDDCYSDSEGLPGNNSTRIITRTDGLLPTILDLLTSKAEQYGELTKVLQYKYAVLNVKLQSDTSDRVETENEISTCVDLLKCYTSSTDAIVKDKKNVADVLKKLLDVIFTLDGRNKQSVIKELIESKFFDEPVYCKQIASLMFRHLYNFPYLAPVFAELCTEIMKVSFKDNKCMFFNCICLYLRSYETEDWDENVLWTAHDSKVNLRLAHMSHLRFLACICHRIDSDEFFASFRNKIMLSAPFREDIIFAPPPEDVMAAQFFELSVVEEYLLNSIWRQGKIDRDIYNFTIRMLFDLGSLKNFLPWSDHFICYLQRLVRYLPKEEAWMDNTVNSLICALFNIGKKHAAPSLRPDVVVTDFSSPSEFLTDKLEFPGISGVLYYNEQLMNMLTTEFKEKVANLCREVEPASLHRSIKIILQLLFHVIHKPAVSDEISTDDWLMVAKTLRRLDIIVFDLALDEVLITVSCAFTGLKIQDVMSCLSLEKAREAMRENSIHFASRCWQLSDIHRKVLADNINKKSRPEVRKIPKNFDKKWHGSNAVIVVQKHHLNVNKTFLAVCSEFFYDKYFINPPQGHYLEVDIDYEAFMLALQYIHHINYAPVNIRTDVGMLKRLWNLSVSLDLRSVAAFCQYQVKTLDPYDAWKIATELKMDYAINGAIKCLTFTDFKKVLVEDKDVEINVDRIELFKSKVVKIARSKQSESSDHECEKYPFTLAGLANAFKDQGVDLDKGMWITVKTKSSWRIFVNCTLNNTVKELCGENVTMMSQGRPLNPSSTLARCGISHGSEIDVINDFSP